MKQRTGLVMAVALVATLAVVSGCNLLGDNGIPGLTEGYGAVTLDIQGTLTGSSAPAASVYSIRAAGDPLSIPVTDVTGAVIGTLTVSDARANLDEIELEQDDDEIDSEDETEQSLEIEFKGPFLVDFVQETVTPELPQIEMLPGTYNNIELDLKKIEGGELDGDGEPLVADTDPLFGYSIYIAGTYTGATAGGAVVDLPFSISLAVDEELELSATGDTPTGFVIEDGQLNPVIIAFRMARWFVFDDTETNGDLLIDFNDLATDGGTAIVLDENSTGDNSTILDIIKDNLEESADYGEDEDESGELESDEDDDPDEEDYDDYMDDDDEESGAV